MEKTEVLKKLARTKTENQTSELKVFTVTRKLLGYVVQVTEKSPKKFKQTFVDKMRNLVISANGSLIRANLCRLDDEKRSVQRKEYQISAYEDFKELESLAFLSVECHCILPKQYEQISKQIDDALRLLAAWMQNDRKRLEK